MAAEKDPELRVALVGRFDDHHAVMCRMHLERVRDLEDGIALLDLFTFQHGAEELQPPSVVQSITRCSPGVGCQGLGAGVTSMR